MSYITRINQIINEIEEQRTTLQSLIEEKKEQLQALELEIPELEAQLADLVALANSNLLTELNTSDETTSGSIIISSPTVVSLSTALPTPNR